MTNVPSSDDLAFYRQVAAEAALAAGQLLQSVWARPRKIRAKGEAGNLVTDADHGAEKLILEILADQMPNHAILAEESGRLSLEEGANDYLWAIDPLDGTTNYAHGYPVACVSIGLLHQGQPIVGAIYDPFRAELFLGAKGLGATCNEQPLQVSAIAKVSDSLLVSGFAYDRRQTLDNNYAEFCYLTHLTRGVRRSGSAALDLAAVASGRLDGYWERGIKPWDVAAGIVLLLEAGGQLSAYDGKPFAMKSGRILATNGLIHAELSMALQEAKTEYRTLFA
ncbi:MAG: inositol monophosphatase family protein [Cyanobacteria bacterium P01_H01_bin.15]